MGRGRKPEGVKLVDKLDGSEHAKRRLAVILKTLTGEIAVEEACRDLSIGEAAFHKMRSAWLGDAVKLLEPKPAGRPASPKPEENARLRELEGMIQNLKLDLRVSQAREELAIALPHVLKSKRRPDEKKSPEAPWIGPTTPRSPGTRGATPKGSGAP